jgi:hypothetical protein
VLRGEGVFKPPAEPTHWPARRAVKHHPRMRIFLSYAAEHVRLAEQVNAA